MESIVRNLVAESARHTALRSHFPKLEDLKADNLKATLADAKFDREVFGARDDEVLGEFLNYGIRDRQSQRANTIPRQKSWKGLTKDLAVHVTHVLHMVQDLGPFGMPVKHAYVLIRFSDGRIDRCDLMPKKTDYNSQLRGFLPGIEVEGKVRYNHWINDERAGTGYALDLYTFVIHHPSLLSVELMRQRLQNVEYKSFNIENNNCQDFVHTVIQCLAKAKEEDNRFFNDRWMHSMESRGLFCCKCRRKRSQS